MKQSLPLLLLATLPACRATPDVDPGQQARTEPQPTVPAKLSLTLTTTITGIEALSYASDLRPFGDWDGDGNGDLLFTDQSAYKDPMQVYVFSPTSGRLLSSPKIPELDVSDERAVLLATGVGDIDGDHRDDMLVLTCTAQNTTTRRMLVQAYGASSIEPLWSCRIDTPNPPYPTSLQVVGDLDGDGVPDFVLGAEPRTRLEVSANSPDAQGWVEARSGRDGHPLWRIHSDSEMLIGSEVARSTDINFDGVPDVALSLRYRGLADSTMSSEDPKHRIEVRCGATGMHLGVLKDTSQARGLRSPKPLHLRGGEDIDGDGVPELVVRSLLDADEVVVYSGRGWKVLARATPHPDPNGREETWFPSAVDVTCDLDGDGWRDLLLGHDEVGTEMGYDYGAIYVQSSRTNELMAAVWGEGKDSKLGDRIAWLGDTDHDGRPEFAAVTTGGIKVWSIDGVPASPAKGAGAK